MRNSKRSNPPDHCRLRSVIPVVSQDSVERKDIACRPGSGQIQCIMDARKACPDSRVLVADTNLAANLTEFSEIPAERPISKETIKGRPAVIVCEAQPQ